MNKRSFLSASLLAGLLLTSCYYDNEEALYPGLPLDVLNDTTNVTFSGTIIPILQTNCWSCHSNTYASSKGKNIFLEDYNDIKSKANDGSLYGSVAWAPFFTPMPMGASKLPAIKIAQIKKWIDAGSPNN